MDNDKVKCQYLNERNVSKITGLSLASLRNDRFLKRGIPYVKIGRSVRYNQDDVISYMEDRKVNTTPHAIISNSDM